MPLRRHPRRPEQEPTLGVAALARRLGVATGTLRTWDRRYGLGPSSHEPGTRRSYTAADVARLTLMRRLMLDGVTAASAAAAAVAADPRTLTDPPTGAQPERAGTTRRRTRPGGGAVLSLGAGGPAARGLARAAMSLDSDTCTALLRSGIARNGVVSTWTDVLAPVLGSVGDRWRRTGAGVEVEHLLSESAEAALRSSGMPAGKRTLNSRPVLLAAIEPEDHRLPLVALAAALVERAVSVRLLGVRLPAGALAAAAGRTGALAVFLWSQGATGPGRLPGAALAAIRPAPALLLGGPGWDLAERELRELPRATWVGDLPAAVAAVLALAGGAAGDRTAGAVMTGGAPAR